VTTIAKGGSRLPLPVPPPSPLPWRGGGGREEGGGKEEDLQLQSGKAVDIMNSTFLARLVGVGDHK
jgi:hypothetical protein